MPARNDCIAVKDLAASRPGLVRRAQEIFDAAHRADPNWPLDRRAEAHKTSARKAWEIKRQRDRTGWIPPDAIQRPRAGASRSGRGR